MVDNISSAGTMIGAVLETAGYVAQSNLLAEFTQFLQTAGAFAYIIALIGALVSVALFGSYRMGLYLLLGPPLFWFVIGTRADVGSVTWQLGGGEPRSVESAFIGPMKGQSPLDGAKVSAFFKYYVQLINSTTRDAVDIILKSENDKDLLWLPRKQVLKILRNASAQKSDLIEILDTTLFGDCHEMMRAATVLADARFTQLHRLGVDKAAESYADARVLKAYLTKIEAFYLERYRKVGEEKTVTPSPAMRDFIAREQSKWMSSGGLDGRNYHELLGNTSTPEDEFLQSEVPNLSLTCAQVWQVSADAIMRDSRWYSELALKAHLKTPLEDTVENRERLCKQVASKLHHEAFITDTPEDEDTDDHCDLTQAAGVYMLQNTIKSLHYSRQINRRMGRMNLMKGEKAIVRSDDMNLPAGERILFNAADRATNALKLQVSEDGKSLQARDFEAEKELKGAEKKEIWRNINIIRAHGMTDVVFGDQLQFQGRRLVQEIFTFATHLPYWQGVLLYLLSIAYPFMALLVLIPGRAISFLYMPLLWFWVKSWDIGFALILVLDKILWNLMPSANTEAAELLREGAPQDVLRSALAIDPVYEIHAHYHYIAMSLFIVPPVTGYAILKAKKSILSSFTDGPKEAARSAGELSAGAYGMNIMTKRANEMYSIRGQGVVNVARDMESVVRNAGTGSPTTSEGKATRAGGVGMSVAALSLLRQQGATNLLNFAVGSGGKQGLSKSLGKSVGAGASTGINILVAETRVKAAHVDAFDPIHGRYSRFVRTYEASYAAVDGGGGYEMNETNVASKIINAEIGRFEKYLDAGQEFAQYAFGRVFGGAGAGKQWAYKNMGLVNGRGKLTGGGAKLNAGLNVGAGLGMAGLFYEGDEIDPRTRFQVPKEGERFDPIKHNFAEVLRKRDGAKGGDGTYFHNHPKAGKYWSFTFEDEDLGTWVEMDPDDPTKKTETNDHLDDIASSVWGAVKPLVETGGEISNVLKENIIPSVPRDASLEREEEIADAALARVVADEISRPKIPLALLRELPRVTRADETSAREHYAKKALAEEPASTSSSRSALAGAPSASGAPRRSLSRPAGGPAPRAGTRGGHFAKGSDRRALTTAEVNALGFEFGYELTKGSAREEFVDFLTKTTPEFQGRNIENVYHGSRGRQRFTIVVADGQKFSLDKQFFAAKVQPMIAEISKEFPTVDPDFVSAIIDYESAFVPFAKSTATRPAMGLGQLKAATFGVLEGWAGEDREIWNAEDSIRSTFQLLEDIGPKYDNHLELMAVAYNQGEPSQNRYYRNIGYSGNWGALVTAYKGKKVELSKTEEGRKYVREVLERYRANKKRKA